MPKLLIMAGGTGGHIFPALAIADALAKKNWEIAWLGTADRMEAKIVPKHDIPFYPIVVKGLRGNGLLRAVAAPFMLIRSVWQAFRIICKVKPDVMLGMGGYASGPGGVAGYLYGLPLVLHEQNAVFGMTNRWLSRIAKHTLTGFDFGSSRYRYVGNPVREDFWQIPPLQTPLQNNILIVGGSLGAQVLNTEVPSILRNLKVGKITHQTGKNNVEAVTKAYANMPDVTVCEFIDEMSNAFAEHDIVICRAGALTVAEVAAAGRVAIFVPYPHAVNNHQYQNAQSLTLAGASTTLLQSNIQDLGTVLQNLLNDPTFTMQMGRKAKTFASPNSVDNICSVLEEVVT
jgi:UDP-N-acetylglucosamine--N-acetylmuramyl-(pentapeptide) pyrophosphoryl-undecaprenol N-acetylglucosamine transferase